MDLQLKGKTALVTGSTAGIGFAIAKSLAAEGATVIVNGRTQQRVDEAIAEIKRALSDADVKGVAGDLSTAAGAGAVTSFADRVDILINNMGIFEIKEFGDIADEDWLRMFEANVLSGVRLGRHYLPKMLANNWGRVIFISSESGLNIPVEMIHYGMTKTAQIAVARGMAELTKGTNVTVNSVLPGPTSSEGVSGFLGQVAEQQGISVQQAEEEFFKNVRPTSLIQRFAQPKEIGDFVAFIASPLAAGLNGSALKVDGGTVKSIN